MFSLPFGLSKPQGGPFRDPPKNGPQEKDTFPRFFSSKKLALGSGVSGSSVFLVKYALRGVLLWIPGGGAEVPGGGSFWVVFRFFFRILQKRYENAGFWIFEFILAPVLNLFLGAVLSRNIV